MRNLINSVTESHICALYPNINVPSIAPCLNLKTVKLQKIHKISPEHFLNFIFHLHIHGHLTMLWTTFWYRRQATNCSLCYLKQNWQEQITHKNIDISFTKRYSKNHYFSKSATIYCNLFDLCYQFPVQTIKRNASSAPECRLQSPE